MAADACNECKRHKDRVYSISGAYSRYPQLKEVPPYHPNCICRVAGYIEGLSDTYDSDEAKRKATKVILPDGKTAGRPGRRKGNWTRSGGLDASREMFETLRPLVRPYENPDYSGTEQIEIPGLGVVGFRPVSIYGEQEPTIDVNATIEGVEVNKIKFED